LLLRLPSADQSREDRRNTFGEILERTAYAEIGLEESAGTIGRLGQAPSPKTRDESPGIDRNS